MAYVNLGQVIYPVGAIFASTSLTSPSSMFGGTWSQITGDACLMAGTAIGNIGSKKIAVEKMPVHKHRPPQRNGLNDYFFSLNRNMALECTARIPIQYQEGSKYFTIGTKISSKDSCAQKIDPNSLDDLVDTGETASTGGGGQTTCLTPTDATCGEELHRGDSSCVIFKMSKSKLIQILKRYAHSQLATSISQLVQPAQLVFMVGNGQLSQMVDSLDRRGLGMVLVEKTNINSLLRKCQVTAICFTAGQILLHSGEVIVGLQNIWQQVITMPLLLIRAVMRHITTFPHTEHAIAGIEHPNFAWEVF